MACFVVAYDLNPIGQNYECITGRIKALTHCHAQGSVWFVEYSGTESELREYLRPCLDQNDRLFVSEVSKSWAGLHMPTCGQWLNERGY
jgi:hypothetical protein